MTFDVVAGERLLPSARKLQLIVRRLSLKQSFDLSDESLLDRREENPYWQYDCGFHTLLRGPDAKSISKDKASMRYEFAPKLLVARTHRGILIVGVGVELRPENSYDGDTPGSTVATVEQLDACGCENVFVDQACRGNSEGRVTSEGLRVARLPRGAASTLGDNSSR